jgi:hypothetical protein
MAHETATWRSADLPDSCATLEVAVIDPGLYHIVGEVARGGVGRIMEAVDTRLQREVAIKELIHPDKNQARFIREAMLTARLQHPGIVAVHEVGVFKDGGPFIAMKLVRGESLRDAVRKRTTLAERMELLGAVLAVVDAVAYAHSQRVIHRDLKPANVLLGKFGEVVVVDWGLAKHLDVAEAPAEALPASGGSDTTALGAIVGTPAYMPPEQALGRHVDERADVYALGGLLYQVLTGAPPITGDSAQEVIAKLLSTRPLPVAERVPEVPADLAVIVDKAMHADAAQRYRDAAELAADLRRFQLGQMLSVPREELEHDPVIEAAFEDELRNQTLAALQLLGVLAMPSIAAFSLVPRLYHGAFVARDLWPRAVTMLALAVIWWLGRTPFGKRWSQQLGVAFLLVVGVFFVVVNVAERNAIGWFTASTLLACLGCMMMPLRPRLVLLTVGSLTVFAALEAILSGLHPLAVQTIVQVALVGTGSLITFVAGSSSFRVRRAELYNRHRLQRANERLARFDRSIR